MGSVTWRQKGDSVDIVHVYQNSFIEYQNNTKFVIYVSTTMWKYKFCLNQTSNQQSEKKYSN